MNCRIASTTGARVLQKVKSQRREHQEIKDIPLDYTLDGYKIPPDTRAITACWETHHHYTYKTNFV